jgi:hypothetical protein
MQCQVRADNAHVRHDITSVVPAMWVQLACCVLQRALNVGMCEQWCL